MADAGCTHDVLFGDLCTLCGADVSSLPEHGAAYTAVTGWGFNSSALRVSHEVGREPQRMRV